MYCSVIVVSVFQWSLCIPCELTMRRRAELTPVIVSMRCDATVRDLKQLILEWDDSMTNETLIVTAGDCVLSHDVDDMPLLDADTFVYGQYDDCDQMAETRTPIRRISITVCILEEFHNSSHVINRTNTVISQESTRALWGGYCHAQPRVIAYGKVSDILNHLLTFSSIQPFAVNLLRNWFITTLSIFRFNLKEKQRLQMIAQIISELDVLYPNANWKIRVMNSGLLWSKNGTKLAHPHIKAKILKSIFYSVLVFEFVCDFANLSWHAIMKLMFDDELSSVLKADWKSTSARNLLEDQMIVARDDYLKSVTDYVEVVLDVKHQAYVEHHKFDTHSRWLADARKAIGENAAAFTDLTDAVCAVCQFLHAQTKNDVTFVCKTHEMKADLLDLLSLLELNANVVCRS